MPIDLDHPDSIDLPKLHAELEQLDAQILDLQRRREARKAVIKAVEIMLHGKPKRRRKGGEAEPPEESDSGACDSDLVDVTCERLDDKAAQRIEAYLNQMGAQTPETLARILAIDQERVELILDKSPIFERDKKGRYRLVPTH